MFDELKEVWITDLYKSYKGILLPSIKKQLSMSSLFLDLNSLPTKPYPFKELFIRWLISINKQRISRNEPIIVNKAIVLMCPLWRIVKCPLIKMELTKDGMFNKPKVVTGTIGTKSSVGTINK
jgi:hypothetical protein